VPGEYTAVDGKIGKQRISVRFTPDSIDK